MKVKQFVVFGLGRFGMSVAMTLSEAGYEVMAVDKSEEKIQGIASGQFGVIYDKEGNLCLGSGIII